MNSAPIKTRFAPSPTGLLHLGNVRTALFNYLLARKHGGSFLLRVEDTDAVRGHEKYTQSMLQDLRWLGLEWHEGVEVGGKYGPYLQSERGPIYDQYFSTLQHNSLAYACFCSEHELQIERKAQLAAGRPPRYSGRCYRLSKDEIAARFAAGKPATLRFHVEDGRTLEFDDKVRGRQEYTTDIIGDFVIRRSNGTPAFFFSNAVDDALMGVTLVVRGEDHLTNTPRQMLILQALELPVPAYAHIALVVGADGAPLSKRHGSRTVQELRESGFLPLAINNYLARLGHTYEENALLELEQLAAAFDVGRLHRAPARFDEAHLLHWQREAVRCISRDELWQWMGSSVHTLVPAVKSDIFIDTVRANVTFPDEALDWARILFSDDPFVLTSRAREILSAVPPVYFDNFLQVFEACAGHLDRFGHELKERTGAKGAAVYRPARAALTSKEEGPELVRLLELMPADRIRRRIEQAKEIAEKT